MLLAAGERLAASVALLAEAHHVNQVFGGESQATGIELVEEIEDLGDGQARIKSSRLELDADAHLDGAGSAGLAVTEHSDVAGIWLAQALDHFDGGGLTGAV